MIIFARQEERRTSPSCSYHSSVSLMMMERGLIFLYFQELPCKEEAVSAGRVDPHRGEDISVEDARLSECHSCITKSQVPPEQFLVSNLQSLVQRSASDLAHSLQVHTDCSGQTSLQDQSH